MHKHIPPEQPDDKTVAEIIKYIPVMIGALIGAIAVKLTNISSLFHKIKDFSQTHSEAGQITIDRKTGKIIKNGDKKKK
jgi:hypothetical protein